MESKYFEALSQKRKREELQIFLYNLNKNDIKSSKSLESRERIIVNRKGEYGFDKAVFDDDVKIPEYLRELLKVRTRG